MKKKKLNLKKLTVQSFKTSGLDASKMQGGAISGALCEPTPDTRCFVCPPFKSLDYICDPTAATMCFICPPFTQGADCEDTRGFVC